VVIDEKVREHYSVTIIKITAIPIFPLANNGKEIKK